MSLILFFFLSHEYIIFIPCILFSILIYEMEIEMPFFAHISFSLTKLDVFFVELLEQYINVTLMFALVVKGGSFVEGFEPGENKRHN